jgi:hypothetical protein
MTDDDRRRAEETPVFGEPLASRGEAQEGEVRHPLSGGFISDPLLRLAVKERAWKTNMTSHGERLAVDWPRFMRPRRRYNAVPDYDAPPTDREMRLRAKLAEGDTLMRVTEAKAYLGAATDATAMRFVAWKEIPVYRLKSGYYIFLGDFARALERTHIDLAADHGAWERFLISAYEGKRAREHRRDRERSRRARQL